MQDGNCCYRSHEADVTDHQAGFCRTKLGSTLGCRDLELSQIFDRGDIFGHSKLTRRFNCLQVEIVPKYPRTLHRSTHSSEDLFKQKPSQSEIRDLRDSSALRKAMENILNHTRFHRIVQVVEIADLRVSC